METYYTREPQVLPKVYCNATQQSVRRMCLFYPSEKGEHIYLHNWMPQEYQYLENLHEICLISGE